MSIGIKGRVNMNIWLGASTLIFITITTIIIYIKRRNIRSIIWDIVRFIVVGIALYIGQGTTQFWEILICSAIIGACLLISILHAYNKLFTSGITYESVGETRKPKPFGNDYWQ